MPSMVCTTSSSPTIAGDDAIFPGVGPPATLPSRIETARTVPREFPMYATPSETTAGNSISAPIPRLQTIRNGGRIAMPLRLRAAGSTPYIGHCSDGR